MNEETIVQSTAWVHGLAEALATAHDRHIAAKIQAPSSRTSNWASSMGHPCELHLTLWRVRGELAQPIDPSLQRVFEEGKKQESLILRELEDMGVTVLERGVAIQTDPTLKALQIHGHLDAKLDCSGLPLEVLAPLQVAYPGVDWRRKRVVAECKSLSPHWFGKLVDYDAMMTASAHYVRSWAEQMQLYLFGHNDEAGLYVFKNKVSGAMRFVPVLLDLATCDALAQKAKRINEAVVQAQATGWVPTPIPWREDVCSSCPFLALCPNGQTLPTAEILADPELAALLEQRATLLPLVREYDEVKEAIDAKLEPLAGQEALVGDWRIRWRRVQKAEKLHPATEYWQKQITKLPGATP